MRFDNGTADRQAHTNSLRFGCVEGFKELAYLRMLQSDAGVLHADQDGGSAIVLVAPGTNPYFSLSSSNLAHGFGAVHDQIEQHLLQLHAIP